MEFFAIGTFFPSCYKTTELLTWTQHKCCTEVSRTGFTWIYSFWDQPLDPYPSSGYSVIQHRTNRFTYKPFPPVLGCSPSAVVSFIPVDVKTMKGGAAG